MYIKYLVGLELFFSHFPGKIDGAAFITIMAQSYFVVLLKQIVPAQVKCNQKKIWLVESIHKQKGFTV